MGNDANKVIQENVTGSEERQRKSIMRPVQTNYGCYKTLGEKQKGGQKGFPRVPGRPGQQMLEAGAGLSWLRY